MNTEDLGVFHCIRHQQNLFAKWMKFNNMTITVVFCTNCINARASTSPTVLRISYRPEPPRLDIFVVDSIGGWVGEAARALLRPERWRSYFKDMKGNSVPALKDKSWLHYLEWREKQFANTRVSWFTKCMDIKSFVNKLRPCGSQLKAGNTIAANGTYWFSRELKSKMIAMDISLEFYQRHFPIDKYPKLVDLARKRMALFGSIYICEHLFSSENEVW